MDHGSIKKAFDDIFGIDQAFYAESYKRIDPHSIEITAYHRDEDPAQTYIFTYYGPKSFKLETK